MRFLLPLFLVSLLLSVASLILVWYLQPTEPSRLALAVERTLVEHLRQDPAWSVESICQRIVMNSGFRTTLAAPGEDQRVFAAIFFSPDDRTVTYVVEEEGFVSVISSAGEIRIKFTGAHNAKVLDTSGHETIYLVEE